MKFGVADYGMNVWEGGCYDITLRLEELRSIGLDGTERLEVCDAADAIYKAAARWGWTSQPAALRRIRSDSESNIQPRSARNMSGSHPVPADAMSILMYSAAAPIN